ncbi:MAG: ATP-binding cassette domain-containing protein [Acidithiobacillus sp.]
MGMVLQLDQGQVEWGGRALLDRADLVLDEGERVGLIGRNGEGKSTLLQVLAGLYPLDGGRLSWSSGLHAAYLAQEPELPEDQDLLDAICAGHPLHQAAQASPQGTAEPTDHPDFWTVTARAQSLCDQLGLPESGRIAALSGGQRKRVAIAQALMGEPDLLFLDEPTNHLDLTGIDTLEKTLARYRGTLVFITHDRRFLDRLATRIVELDRGKLSSFPGSFRDYLKRKEEMLAAEAAASERLEGQLAEEEAWLRQGVKARAKRNQGRLRRLERLRDERRQRRQRLGTARLDIAAAERSGSLVAELTHVSFSYDDRPIVEDLSIRIERGDRIAIVGPNGVGKTTLLRLILGELPPQKGQVRQGTRLELAYFDQFRAQLDPDMRVVDAVADGSDFLDIGGERRHVLSYLQDFLFPPGRARGPVKALSGGERARLLLARLFARPANLLVLDEPTNDLDLETLEVLEERLQTFPGTVILVSHDREFLDQVATQVLVSRGDGQWLNMAGGYSDWEAWQQQAEPPHAGDSLMPIARNPTREKEKPRKAGLSFRERQDLEQLPAQIEALEARQESIAAALADPDLYREPDRLKSIQEEAKAVAAELDAAYARWALLESKASEASA